MLYYSPSNILYFSGDISAMANSAPLFKVGMMTDTHINHTPGSCKKLKAALKRFAAEKVDIMINCGDIANHHNLEAYKLYRRLINEVYASEEKKPEEIFISAYHDWTKPPEAESSFASMKEALQVPHNMQDKLTFKGYNFLIIPQNITMENLESAVAAAVAETPGRTVFVIDHIPPYGIFHNGKLWGDQRRFDVMKKFPSALHISGHIHASLFDESNIWQGDFSAVNLGGLANWGGDFAGVLPKSKPAGEVVIMEVFKEKLLFRRISVINSKEYAPDSPWCIPLPFHGATAPYNAARRKAASLPPAFSPRAKIKLSTEGRKFEALKIRFPEAAPEVFKYKVKISQKNADGTFRESAIMETPGNFYKAASYRKSPVELSLPALYFEKGKNYNISVIPVNFYEKEGTPLSTSWKAPAPADSKLIFESGDPMKELSFFAEAEGETKVKKEGEFYTPESYSARLEFPENVLAAYPPETKVRMVVDLHTIQESDDTLPAFMTVANPAPLANLSGRIFTAAGDVRSRYAAEFPVKAGMRYTLLLRSCSNIRIKFDYVKLELVSLPGESK